MNSSSPPAAPEETLEIKILIKKLLDYLPIIVLVVILLVLFISWDLMQQHWIVFATLIIAFIFIMFIHFLSPNRYISLRETPLVVGAPPAAQQLTWTAAWTAAWAAAPKIGTIIIIASILFLFGIGLGFGSIGVSNTGENYNNYNKVAETLTWSGIGLLGIVVVLLIVLFIVWKYVGFVMPTKILGIVCIACIVFSLPMIVIGKKMEEESGTISNEKKDEFLKNLADSTATGMLIIGVIFQILSVLGVITILWTSSSQLALKSLSKIISGIIMAILWIIAVDFFYRSEDDANDSFKNKTFLTHGITYFILGFLLIGLVMRFSFTTINFFKGIFILILLAFFVFIILTLRYMYRDSTIPDSDTILKNETTNEYMNSSYYQQLRKEVIKELQQKNPTADLSGTTPSSSELVNNAMNARLDIIREKTQNPALAVTSVFVVISAFIVVFILIVYNVRLKMADCGFIPHAFPLGDAFSYVFKDNDCTAATGKTDLKDIDQTYPDKVKQDKMLSSDWDNILSKQDAGRNNFSTHFVRFAKWFSFIPFLSVILLVMWVSILFTNITTSTSTSDWIVNKFTGDMFPRVKELIDTFFIILIVGLLLCGILLFPIVKELNVGGLDYILRFAESIQVWQYKEDTNTNTQHGKLKKWVIVIVGFLAIFFIGLSWWWTYLTQTRKGDTSIPIIPDNWGWAIAFVVLLAICSMPALYNIVGSDVDDEFKKENIIKRGFRLFLTTVYLIPFLFVTIFKVIIYGIGFIIYSIGKFINGIIYGNNSLSGLPDIEEKLNNELNKFNFTKWSPDKIDLRMFPTDEILITPKSVTSVEHASGVATTASIGIDETKVSGVGKLIKVILLTMSFVILILAIIYYVYKIDATNRSGTAENDTSSGGFVAQMNSPTAHTIYVIMAIVGIAGLVSYLRQKFVNANTKTPEDYLFDDYKPEDMNSPMRQLTFGMTHIIYIVLMIIVWIYDTDKDGKPTMTGMTVLGIAILFFHYGLEFIDNKKPPEPGAKDTKPHMAPLSDLLTNIRFIINTVFFIILCVLAHYKQHGVMVVLIAFMFLFHLSKSILGMKLLKFLWACIIYIPCLFLDLLQSSQTAVGDTTRPIWIIVAIELLLITILYGGPYLLNYIGASASQIVGAPVSLKQKYDTEIDTQSSKIFIYHNTGKNRTPQDIAAGCPAEEKKRYNYAISGWFFLNNNITTTNTDLEIFNFGDVPKMTYNASKNELKLKCQILNDEGQSVNNIEELYNSRTNYNTINDPANTEERRRKMKMLVNDDELDADIPLQKWNYFVINYNGKTMDFFLNNKLIFKSTFKVPDIQLKTITVGDTDNNKGLNGRICNFSFHKEPLTKEQIRWTYTMLKSQNPPMIGMTTITDEAKAAGSTTVYSQ